MSDQNKDLQADLRGEIGDSLTELDCRRQVAPRYISQVVRLESHNFPVISNPAINEDGANCHDDYPYTDYRITVADVRWIAHLQPDEEWGTVAHEEADW